MKKLKLISVFSLVLIIGFISFVLNLSAEEIERIHIEKIAEIEPIYKFETGTDIETILKEMPNTVTGYDSSGTEYEIKVSWETDQEVNTDITGQYVCKMQVLEEQFILDCDLPEIHLMIYENEEQNQEEENKSEIKVNDETSPYDLKINLLDEPWGIICDEVSFSWINSMDFGNGMQTAYRIVICSRLKDAEEGTYVFDSGWIEDTSNTSVQLDLSSYLQDNELYYWQVQIRDRQGEESAFSLPQAFTTSVQDEWLSTNGIWGRNKEKVCFFRTEISIPSGMEKAVLNVTALDGTKTRQYVYNMYVNDAEIGLGPVRPNGKSLTYDSYDITDEVQEGKNVIGVIGYSENNSAFLCQLTVYLEDGTKQILTNSGANKDQWKVMNGDQVYVGDSNTSIGTVYYTAVQDNVNAAVFPYGWLETGFNTSAWISPVVNRNFDSYTLTSAQNDTYRHYEVIPQTVTRQTDGSYLVDFGKEIIGSIRLSVTSSRRVITLEYGEQLDQKGNAKYQMATGNTYQENWTLKSGVQEISGIGMKTFRYVTIRNFPAELTTADVTGLTVRNAFDEEASSFESSNEVLSDLYQLAKYTSKTTTQGLYVDTQSRERLSYEGDNLITGMTSYSFSATSTAFLNTSSYLLDNTTWPAEYALYNIMSVYQNYMYTGDGRALEESYQSLKKNTWEEYFDSSQGLMGKDVNSLPKIMVDWPTSEADGYKFTEAYYNTVFNAVCVGGYEDMARIADILGYESERVYYQNLADTIRENMINKLYNSETGRFCDGLNQSGKRISHSAQHATAFALAFGIYDSQEMADHMADSIEEDGEIQMSVYGSYFLLQGLYNSNNGTLARKLMSNPETTEGVKSWAYMMYGLNATITSEAWNYTVKPNMSLSHAWGSAPGSMLVRGMFGIKPTSPGFDTFEVKLQPGGVDSASVKVPTMKGSIEVSYNMTGNGSIQCQVSIPANTNANIYLPSDTWNKTIMVNGIARDGLLDQDGYVGCSLESGTYTLQISSGISEDQSELLKTDIVSNAYTSDGWYGEKTNGLVQGSAQGGNIQAVSFRLRNAEAVGNIVYQSYMQTYGWMDEVENGEVSGIPDGNKRLEAIRIQLTDELAENYDIYYRVYVEGWGWLDWAQNGEPAGSSGYGKCILAIDTEMLKKGEEAPGDRTQPYKNLEWDVSYTTHVQSYGWQPVVGDGETSGTEGEAKRLEAIQISANIQDVTGDILYRTHVQSYGWQDWVKNGDISGTEGEAKRLEAIQIQLTGELSEKYDIYYRVHAQSYGWLGWAKNGESAGTEGMSKRLEAIQIRLVRKGNAAPGSSDGAFIMPKVYYQTHVQTYGWQNRVYDGSTSGTEGQAKRLEAIKISLYNPQYSGDIEYATHVQSYGWLDWVKNGALSGTEGQAKRLEAIKIKLTGELSEKYDIYYRVHAQSYGWLGWAKNGEEAGTEGLSKRLEAIQIQIVEKGENAPGTTDNHFIKPKIIYQTHIQISGWQGLVCDGDTSGTEGKAKRLEAIRIKLYDQEASGDIEYSTHVQTYGWMNWVSNGVLSGTEGQAKRLEAIKIRLTGDIADKYDVYYRVHAQTYGWLGWAKNGEEAGTEGLAKRLEAIQIMLVEKNGKAPGSAEKPFLANENS